MGGAKLNNRWIVPYNPNLLLKFNAHINVEIYKGHDKAIVEFRSGGENVDTAEAKSVNEFSEYLEGKCLLLRRVIVSVRMRSMPI